MKFSSLINFLSLLFLSLFLSCSSDDDSIVNEKLPEEEVVEEEIQEPETPVEVVYPIQGDTGTILSNNKSLSQEGYVLVNESTDDRVYLMEKDSALIVHEWQLEFGLGNDVELLSDGRLLASLGVETPDFSFGGFGGIIQLINPDSSVDWQFTYANEEHIIHHDVEMLPNGNVLAIVWDLRTIEELNAIGYLGEEDKVYTETIIEVNPNTDEIVWKWESWDHIVQDVDDSKPRFGIINEHPELININYIDILRESVEPDGDIMHANGFDYDEENDVIYMTINNFSEIWVIDHSTTIEEAKLSTGGNYGKGGDLLYRFGNPTAYENSLGERMFYNNHFPNLLENDVPGNGNILVYVNGNGESKQSVVYELEIPSEFDLQPNANNDLNEVWSYTREGLYAPRVSGAVRLDNGNTLITSGTSGILEVTNQKEVVWEFRGTGFYWRSYHYNFDSDATSFLSNNTP
ncbi:aryl-sulfate sulfotransferase [Maribacter sp. SA7]|uniref:aryl-sulfate sulfotransferase n=1 Tax=Maribacter zhoushanensis TaxID=3030012 RepID=UPI0023ED1C11|nr:aryl-sulfate sulfotransferase [Maribacter zhoushanensis]MDF4203983.1 aryl-sulfate sulfotransferase [Maribacter zhoushanensis]